MSFVHHFENGSKADAPPLILLHGTGGDEYDLVPLAKEISPESSILSPRGKVRENGMNRFFRRFAEGVFDLEDIKLRSDELAQFLSQAAQERGFPLEKALALGFSNGANMAAALLLLRPGLLGGGILLRATVPIEPETPPRLDGKRVLLSTGDLDQMIPLSGALDLARRLREAGADVTHVRQARVGHGLTQKDVEAAKAWIQGLAVQ